MIGRNGQRAHVYSRDGRLVYERAPGGSTTKHIYLAGRLVGSMTGSTTTYLHTDTLGTVVRRTNAAGVELGPRQTWEPYGSLSNGQYLQAPGFTGHVSDVHSGLIYMQQRHYDPVAMRFMSVDPVHVDTGNGGNFNRYWYANNNPYRYVDPDGRIGVDAIIDIGYVLYDAGNFLGASAAAAVGALTGNDALKSVGLEGMADTALNLAMSGASLVTPGVSAPMVRGADSVADAAKRGTCPSCGNRTTTSQEHAADVHGMSRRQVGDGIHELERGAGTATPRRNPDHEICLTCGEVFPQAPNNSLGDTIGNIKEFRSK